MKHARSPLPTVLGLSGLSGLVLLVSVAACGGATDEVADPPTTVNGTDPVPGGSSGSTASTAPTTAPDPRAPVACGAATCPAGAEECCVSVGPSGGSSSGGSSGGSGGTPGVTASCVAVGKCGGDLALTCSSSASCGASQACCLDGSGGGGLATATCKASCSGTGGARPVQLCSTDAECKSGKCQEAQLGLKVCTSSGGGGGGKDGGRRDGGKFDGGSSSGSGGDAGAFEDDGGS